MRSSAARVPDRCRKCHWVVRGDCGAEAEQAVEPRAARPFDGRAVARANGQRTVHHELHVAGAAGAVARRRNLLDTSLAGMSRSATGRNNPALKRPLSRLFTGSPSRVPARLLMNLIASWQNGSGQPCRRKRAADASFDSHAGAEHHDVRVQLPLVFVDALDLRVEDRLGIHHPPGRDSTNRETRLPSRLLCDRAAEALSSARA